MNNENIEYDLEYLRSYFKNINDHKIKFTLGEFIKLIGIYRDKYFNFELKEDNNELIKEIFNFLYSEVKKMAGVYVLRGEYKNAANLYKMIEQIVLTAYIKKIIKFTSMVEYSYNLSLLLYKTDEDFESINRCGIITSEFFVKNTRIKNFISIKEEDKNPERYNNDYSRYLEFMILFSKLGQLICSKVGLNEVIGNYYFRQKFFEEKLLYKLVDIPYVYTMVTERLYIGVGDFVSHIVVDSKQGKKGIKKLIINFKLYLKAIRYSLIRITTGYGERPFNLLKSSLVLILVWSMIYSFVETASVFNFVNYFFQSFLIFTAFGLTDNTIILKDSNKIWMSVEITLGIIFINGFIVTLARKYFR